jgi:hypothetical protein
VLIVGWYVGRRLVIAQVSGPDARAAAGAVWDAFLGDLRTAACASLVAVGLVCLLARDAVLQVLFTATGFYLIFAGVSAILWLVYEPRERKVDAEAPVGRGEGARRRRPLVATLVGGASIAGAIALFVGTGGTTTAAPAAGPCNGDVQLCGRSLPQVALAATHNSMSVPLPGWFSSEQDAPIAAQLRYGIPRAADRHPLRRPARRREAAYRRGRPGRAPAPGGAGWREPQCRRLRPAPARTSGVLGQRRARHVPVPLVLRAGGHAAGRRAAGPARRPGHQPRRGHGGDQTRTT